MSDIAAALKHAQHARIRAILYAADAFSAYAEKDLEELAVCAGCAALMAAEYQRRMDLAAQAWGESRPPLPAPERTR